MTFSSKEKGRKETDQKSIGTTPATQPRNSLRAALTHRPPVRVTAEQGGIHLRRGVQPPPSPCSRRGDGKALQPAKEGAWMPAETQTSAKAQSGEM